VVEILSTFGASLVTQGVVMTAVKFVPFFGWVTALTMAYAVTYSIGEVSDHYFKTGRGVSPDALRDMFEKIYKSKKAEKQAAVGKDTSLKSKLEQLTAAFEAGLLT